MYSIIECKLKTKLRKTFITHTARTKTVKLFSNNNILLELEKKS